MIPFSDAAKRLPPMNSLDCDYLASRAAVAAELTPAPNLFTLGLDLGKAQDFSALCIIERHGQAPAWQHQVRHLHRWPLGTSYPDIIRDLAALVSRVPGRPENIGLAVDVTGVGLGVYDFIRQAQLPVKHVPILIVSGRAITQDERGVHHVPKVELVSTMAAVLGSHRLAVAQLPLAAVLRHELSTFTVKVTAAGNETYEAWRERDHDDVVLAAAMAVYVGERQRRRPAIHC